MKENETIYKRIHPIRIVTATSLFDGHDVTINIIRRILQDSGAEVIHLGHNRSIDEIVDCSIEEDAQAIALTCYQGGYMESFKYMYDLLQEKNAGHIRIFGGGGGTILPEEIKELHEYGIKKIFSPDDGRKYGLQGMINYMLEKSDFSTTPSIPNNISSESLHQDKQKIGQLISIAENHPEQFDKIQFPKIEDKTIPILGVTGPGGAGKSTLIDELLRRFLLDTTDKNIAVISIDPTKRKSGGALLGDRIRMNSLKNPRVFMRSMATRKRNTSVSTHIQNVIKIFKANLFDAIIIETSGTGQSASEIVDFSDVLLYVMTPEYGAETQLEKINMLDYADFVALNKIDKSSASDALRQVKSYYTNNKSFVVEDVAVFGTMASNYNDLETDNLYGAIIQKLKTKTGFQFNSRLKIDSKESIEAIIPANRTHYLSEIISFHKDYRDQLKEQSQIASNLYQLKTSLDVVKTSQNHEAISQIESSIDTLSKKLDDESKEIIQNWQALQAQYNSPTFSYKVRDKVFETDSYYNSLSDVKIPKVCLPKLKDWGDILTWTLQENVAGKYPFTSGVFPLKRREENPTRMTAGEGGPERSNKRFHYLCKGQLGKRISTAHDSVTLYGEDPSNRPDIYGKIGSTGVSICNIDDAKKLYSGFNLLDKNTSVNLTINGPSPIILAFFLNAAIDQQCELYIHANNLEEEVTKKIESYFRERNIPRPTYNGSLPEGHNGLGLFLLGISGDQVLPPVIYEEIKANTLRKVRGTVQADILKEDQAQNTCIFSANFSLKMMGDVQEYFIKNKVKSFYSISVSGYHMAEAGANVITQLAFTLANAFTYIEYYLSRGMHIDDFASNISFFFSNGMDAEYAVLGRVARRIWARTIKLKYNGNERSQKLKYHVQTSGRSLHAQEIGFNDIRTTLQAFYALADNCNSLHTNANDEAITLPTEDSVRRALAIQLIIDKEFGLAKNENVFQGSYIIDELTSKVEEAVLEEFQRISDRGGVIGAMETMYQRSKIQEESLKYETLKHNGHIPLIGVNTFLNSEGSPTIIPQEVIRSTQEERDAIITAKDHFIKRHEEVAESALETLKVNGFKNENLFQRIMEVSKICTLGQISNTLYEIGGEYRRNN